ncbi:uncharacterized protein LOC130506189 [Raphanus sativus]|uniref:Uncharacterized protein LOC130506189 n=1 Tax=Raphanus sativus TaxID=3726 RepID=A0A9W3CYW0_RAPSA|nr:uncharacterized protein LOC130506189 [Raphanus sativus]
MRKRRREADLETTPNPSEIGLDDLQVLVTPKNNQKKVVTTTENGLGDSEISRTPKNQQEDKKRQKKQKKVNQDTLLKPKKLQKHKLRNKKKQKKVATTTEHFEIDSDDPKKLKKITIIDELSDRCERDD